MKLTSSCILQRIPQSWHTGLGTPLRVKESLGLVECVFTSSQS